MPHSTCFAHRTGHAEVSPAGECEAGSFQSYALSNATSVSKTPATTRFTYALRRKTGT